jgi:hypothetical protein
MKMNCGTYVSRSDFGMKEFAAAFCRREGADACNRGEGLDGCPYPAAEEARDALGFDARNAWIEGWHRAHGSGIPQAFRSMKGRVRVRVGRLQAFVGYLFVSGSDLAALSTDLVAFA